MNAPEDDQALFTAEMTVGAYGTRTYVFGDHVADGNDVRGPGPARRTRGPEDAKAPRYWVTEAEAITVAIAMAKGTVTSDDLRDHYADEPSATGAAIGALFRSLSRQGRLVLDHHRPSNRPEARGRVVGVWRLP